MSQWDLVCYLVIIFFYSSSVFARFKGTYLYALTLHCLGHRLANQFSLSGTLS